MHNLDSYMIAHGISIVYSIFCIYNMNKIKQKILIQEAIEHYVDVLEPEEADTEEIEEI